MEWKGFIAKTKRDNSRRINFFLRLLLQHSFLVELKKKKYLNYTKVEVTF